MSRKPTPFPTKEEVLRFIEESDGRVGKREIARAFGIRGNDRVALKELLRTLDREGAITRERRRTRAAGTLPAVCVLDVVALDRDGELLARPARWDSEDAPPRIFVAPARGVRAPALGDRVLARLSGDPGAGYTAKPIRVLDAARQSFVGVYQETATGEGRIQPAERTVRHDFTVAATDAGDAKPGELVRAEALPGRALGLPRARVLERLGAASAPGAVSLIAIQRQGIPTEFSAEAIALAEAARAPGAAGRSDLRALPLVTIDGPDARDFDDAVWAEADPDPANPGGWRLVVAIADVAHFVRPGDPLDLAARERGNSVYFPDRVVPMLPEALSAGLCSLKPDEDRACLAARLTIDAAGTLLRHRFERGLMRSAARLTYRDAQEAGERDDHPLHERLGKGRIAALFGAYHALRGARETRGALDLDLPETEIVLASDGSVERMAPAPRYDSHRLIEEFMITANVAAAEALEAKGWPCMYRVHDQPDPVKVEALRGFLDGLGMRFARGGRLTAARFNEVVRRAAGTRRAEIINLFILRTQAQAAYSPHNIGHFGLGLGRYAHFTSPIRRYADLLVHRALIGAYRLGEGGIGAAEGEAFPEVADHISATERRAQAAERETADRYAALYMADRVGAEFDGRIAGLARFGVFVSLDGLGAEGLVPASSLGGGRPRFDERRQTLTVDRRTLSLGERVRVRLLEADGLAGRLAFELRAVDGKAWSSDGAARRGRRRR